LRRLGVLLAFLLVGSGCAVINHPTVTATSYVVQGVRFYFSNFVPSEIVISSKGTGETREKAIDNALIAAVQEALGVLVVSDVTIKDDQILNNIAIMYSEGVVNSYKVKECIGETRQVCEITATVSASRLQKKFGSSSAGVEVDGNSLYAQHLTAKNAIIQRSKLTEYYFSGIRKYGLEPKIKSINIIPSTDSFVTIEMLITVGWNIEFRENIIDFVKKLEIDTHGRSKKEKDNVEIYVRDMPKVIGFTENRSFYINPYDANFRKILISTKGEPILMKINPFNHCEYLPAPFGTFSFGNFKGGNIFALSKPIEMKLRIKVLPELVKTIDKFSIQMGCSGHLQPQLSWSQPFSSWTFPSPSFSLPEVIYERNRRISQY